MQNRYTMLAAYNRWSNDRLYQVVASLPDAEYRADRGAFFKSIEGTLNHLLLVDRIWMQRFTGTGDAPTQLDAILHDDLASLRKARIAEDDRIQSYVDGLTAADLNDGVLRYRTVVKPVDIEQPLTPALDHFFNHQTHHRGQAHCLLTAIVGNDATPSFDLIMFQRETGIGLR